MKLPKTQRLDNLACDVTNPQAWDCHTKGCGGHTRWLPCLGNKWFREDLALTVWEAVSLKDRLC